MMTSLHTGQRSRVALAVCIALTGVGAAVAATDTGSSPQQSAVLATIGTQSVTEAEIISHAHEPFDQQQRDYQRELRRLQVGYELARHDLLAKELDKVLDRQALEVEAKARGVAPEAVLAEAKIPPVTEQEMHAFYEENKGRGNQTYEQISPQIKEYLANRHNDDAMRAFYDRLRAKHHIHSQLEPYRIPVADTGPARGNTRARVTIVEFADFQCPYCRMAETALHSVIAKHPDDVRLVFRQLPLTQVHPNALAAAEAAVCADRQGKFWDLHDAMFADQNALSVDGLKATVGRIGLDADRFAACMQDDTVKGSIDKDAREAGDLGIESTPYFFVNGRPISGSLPVDKFEAIVADEIRRASKAGG